MGTRCGRHWKAIDDVKKEDVKMCKDESPDLVSEPGLLCLVCEELLRATESAR